MERIMEILGGVSKVVILATVFIILIVVWARVSGEWRVWLTDKPIALGILSLYTIYVSVSIIVTSGIVLRGDRFMPDLPRKKDFIPWPVRAGFLLIPPFVFYSMLFDLPTLPF